VKKAAAMTPLYYEAHITFDPLTAPTDIAAIAKEAGFCLSSFLDDVSFDRPAGALLTGKSLDPGLLFDRVAALCTTLQAEGCGILGTRLMAAVSDSKPLWGFIDE
jgi:hypothetical protein